eukprot:CAMPEP_0115874078 /NCGR_PEP_ID=MMETSP0287-20121206/24343_1 /TAXON_ID=412157 /ORGANISM="Chrysochromulina rotalis, Strain UIO044" /LENGTH=34 /DNA_ID= /DNA_START= /DNA_END= /DNA_ORIENTATION=
MASFRAPPRTIPHTLIDSCFVRQTLKAMADIDPP